MSETDKPNLSTPDPRHPALSPDFEDRVRIASLKRAKILAAREMAKTAEPVIPYAGVRVRKYIRPKKRVHLARNGHEAGAQAMPAFPAAMRPRQTEPEDPDRVRLTGHSGARPVEEIPASLPQQQTRHTAVGAGFSLLAQRRPKLLRLGLVVAIGVVTGCLVTTLRV